MISAVVAMQNNWFAVSVCVRLKQESHFENKSQTFGVTNSFHVFGFHVVLHGACSN